MAGLLDEMAERWAREAAERRRAADMQATPDERGEASPARGQSALEKLRRDREAHEDQPRPAWRRA